MKKFLSLFLVLVILLAVLSSCGLFGGDDVTESDTEPTETEPSKISLIQAGEKTKYTIIYPDDASDELVALVNFMVSEMNETYPGIEITCQPAFKSWGATPASDYEILIGDTGREESIDAAALIEGQNEYIIKLYDNGNLVIMGNNDTMLCSALNYILANYIVDTSRAFEVEEKLEFKYTDSNAKRNGWYLHNIPSYWSGTLSSRSYATGQGLKINNGSAGGNMQVISDTNLSEYNQYLASLISEGYTCVASNTIGNNKYAQYQKGSILVYAYYTGSQNEVRIIHDTASDPENVFEYSYTAKESDTTTFYQYAMMYDPTGLGGYDPDNGKTYENNGLFDVIKLADNSVVLLDGGWSPQATDNATAELMKFLREITSTPTGSKVRIAAVYFTHGHGDHVSFIQKLIENHADEIIIERAMYNFMSSSSEISEAHKSVGVTLASEYPNIKFAKLHTGQKIQLADVTFEVMYTHEDMVSADGYSEIIDFNNTSTILKMNINGKTFMLTGDWGGNHTINNRQETIDEYKLLEAQFLAAFAPEGGTNYLKCDVVQISHHAINDWMENVYAAIDADVAFFPQQDVAYNRLAHACYKNIVQQLERTGMSREDMHFAGRYTYGMTVTLDGTMKLSYRNIAGADSAYLTQISKYSPFHQPTAKTY